MLLMIVGIKSDYFPKKRQPADLSDGMAVYSLRGKNLILKYYYDKGMIREDPLNKAGRYTIRIWPGSPVIVNQVFPPFLIMSVRICKFCLKVSQHHFLLNPYSFTVIAHRRI
jgi:hypothetical protein